MSARIIEVGLSTNRLAEIQPTLEACLRDTGDILIGHQEYDDLTLLVVRLLGDTMQCHLDILSAALRTELINSFQVVNCQLFKVVFRQERAKMSLRDFPLHVGESWFTAADDEKAAYLCLDSPQLTQKQITWLATQTSIAQWTKAY